MRQISENQSRCDVASVATEASWSGKLVFCVEIREIGLRVFEVILFGKEAGQFFCSILKAV